LITHLKQQTLGNLSDISWREQVNFQSDDQGRIQDFKIGGAHLKKLRRAEGGANIFGVFRVKNHDFTPQNHIFPILGEGARNFWGISCEKSRFYAKKIIFIPILGGGARRVRPPLNPPLMMMWSALYLVGLCSVSSLKHKIDMSPHSNTLF
jgi:hypothetical protein